MRRFITTVLFVGVWVVPSSLLAATPTISNVSGTVANGQVLTISGGNMVEENKTSWSSFNKSHTNADGFEGPSPSVDGYSAIGPAGGIYDSSVKILGSKSIKFHVNGPNTQNVGDYNAYNIGSTATEMWFRYYVRYRASNNIWFNNYAKQLYLMGAGGNYYLDVAGGSGMPSQMKTTVGSGVNTYGNIPSGTLQNDRWYLVEVHVVSRQIMDVWVDNSKIISTPSSYLTESVEQRSLLFGIPNAKESPSGLSVDNWWDGLVSASSRIYGASTIEISGDGSTWKYQEPVFLSDTSSQIKVNLSGVSGTSYRLRVTNNQQQTSSIYTLSGTGGGGGTTPPPTPTDTTAPVISNPQPASTLTFGTVSTTMRVTTNENATCKYGTSNVAYASLPSTFSTTGATSHSTSLTGLTNGSSVTYYVRCTDSSGKCAYRW